MQDSSECEGECKPLKDCQSLNKIWTDRPVSKENIAKLKNARAECLGGNFCCVDAYLDWKRTLETFLPKNCGHSSQNRIIGGLETKINEYPWTVKLNYNKRE